MLGKTKSVLAKISWMFPYTAGILLVFLVSIIANDLWVNWIDTYPARQISKTARFVSNIGMISGTIAVSFYTIRTIYTTVKKRSLLVPVIDSIVLTLVQLLRPIHTTVGAVAVFFISIHGYMFLFKIHRVFDDKIILTGLIAYALILVLTISGILLAKNTQNKTMRISHRVIGLIMTGMVALHLIFKMFD
jgi:hypothetical protein